MTKPDNMEERLEAVRLWEATVAADDAIYHASDDLPQAEFDVLEKAAQDARQAYENHPLTLMENHDGDAIERCGLTDVPLILDDQLLEDTHTGEMFLRSALGLPPRKEEVEEKEMAEVVA